MDTCSDNRKTRGSELIMMINLLIVEAVCGQHSDSDFTSVFLNPYFYIKIMILEMAELLLSSHNGPAQSIAPNSCPYCYMFTCKMNTQLETLKS